jgi:hypothetical protein
MKKRRTRMSQTDVNLAVQEQSLDTPSQAKWHLIALKAYELYEQRGREDGHALEDWLKAEAIINGTTE